MENINTEKVKIYLILILPDVVIEAFEVSWAPGELSGITLCSEHWSAVHWAVSLRLGEDKTFLS